MRNFFLIIIAATFFSINANSEIINIQNEEKIFGDWKVFCEVDDMMSLAHCKIASKFFENTAVITVEPSGKALGSLLLLIPQIKHDSFVQIRVDKNDLIFSQNSSGKDFGMINLTDEQKNLLYNQMKSGNSLFMRFNARSFEKEITVKISLKDFRNALSYYSSRMDSK